MRSRVRLHSMTNCKKPILRYVDPFFHTQVLEQRSHCCRYRLMGCLNSLFYFLLYNAFIRSGHRISYVYKCLCLYVDFVYTLMRLLCIVLFHLVFDRLYARARTLVRHYCAWEKGKHHAVAEVRFRLYNIEYYCCSGARSAEWRISINEKMLVAVLPAVQFR